MYVCVLGRVILNPYSWSDNETLGQHLRRSTTEIHPILSDAPHLLRELHTSPEHLLASIKMNSHPDEWSHVCMSRAYQNIIFRNKIWHSDDFGLRNFVIQKQNSGNVIPLSLNTSFVRVMGPNAGAWSRANIQ